MAIQITPLPLFLENQKPQNQNDPEFTIVGMGNIREEKKSRKPVFPNKLQYAKMKQIPAKKCFKSYLPELNKKPLPKDFTKSLKKGFCLKGKNKETSCTGDSGAPAFWHNNNGERKFIFSTELAKSSLLWVKKRFPSFQKKYSRPLSTKRVISESILTR